MTSRWTSSSARSRGPAERGRTRGFPWGGGSTGSGSAATGLPDLWPRVCALGVAQIVSWGTLFYTPAVLGAAMRDDLGVGDTMLFGSLANGCNAGPA